MKCFHNPRIYPGERPITAKLAAGNTREEYIVERVVNRCSEYLQYCGRLCIGNLSACLCGPLTLCDVSVINAERRGYAESGCMANRRASIRLTLLCTVADSRGYTEQGMAMIDVECRETNFCAHQTCVRTGAQIRVIRACFAEDGTFDVRLDICLQTVFTRPEILCAGQCREEKCCFLPLYPHLHVPQCDMSC